MNMPRRFGCVLSLAAATVLSACNPVLMSGGTDLVDNAIIQHVPYSGSFNYAVDSGSPARDVYFVFTNTSTTHDAAQNPTVNGAVVRVDDAILPAPQPQPMYANHSAPATAAERIAEFNRDPFKALGPGSASRSSARQTAVGELSFDAVGDPRTFKDLGVSVPAHCQYVSPAVTVADGTTRILNIWVADDCWAATGGTVGTVPPAKRHLVDQAMVDKLAAKFLVAGLNNDIYDWDTAVVGAEWGPHSFTNLIPPNGEITILLSDIGADYSDDGGIVGYFWAGNNFTTSSVPDSDQRIMFVIDAVIYANPDANGATGTGSVGWTTDAYWPRFVFSSLAHELQHMIQFYQKQIKQNIQTGTDTWINEMCSMLMEDLVSNKLGVEGPRGVSPADGSAGSPGITLGRIPDFNAYSYYPLAQTGSYDLIDYAVSYSFGSWLARNYGGAALVRRIVQSPQTDASAIVNAVEAFTGRNDESLARLLEKWSVAVLLSDTTNAPAGYRYNTGGWTTTSQGGLSFSLGSIDIFNYVPSLYVFSGSGNFPSSVFYRSSNVYYLAAKNLGASKKTWKITLPPGVLMSVVIK